MNTDTHIYDVDNDAKGYYPNPTDKNIIMHQLRPIKQYINHKNKQLDSMYLSVGVDPTKLTKSSMWYPFK